MTALSFRVWGQPAPQGSHRHVGNGRMVESSKYVKPWRQDVTAAALAAAGDDWVTLTGPVVLIIQAFFARPKSHYRSGAHAHELKPNAPTYKASAPDADKIARGICDALAIAGIYRNDAQVACLQIMKFYGTHPGAHIRIEGIDQ